MFWTGLIVGVVIGGNLGVIVMAVFKSGKN
jgi:hypothetical protein